MDKLFVGSIESDGVKIHYSRTSQDFPSVIMLHGLTDSGLCFSHLAYALFRLYDVVLPDARGHGLSDAPGRGYDVAQFAKDVKALASALGLQKPVVIGHSMGAATAARLAADFPESLSGVVLIDPPWFSEDLCTEERYEISRKTHIENIQNYHRMTMQELDAHIRKEHPNWHEDEYLNWCKSKQQVKEEVIPIIRSIVEGWKETADRIHCPTLLMTGNPNLGAIVSAETSAELAAKHLDWTIINFPNAGHSIQRDSFEDCKNSILDFLKKVY
ncbi:alpha/beta fold hydrolase [Flexilinea flocculi]|uniref:Pimeloyl-ACP methyl ester carboxylesterase n=1 Tax=Flexilinea flocculi TaxID=1678840 RepID=A0A0S7BX36_9CHLR|nr:alpha/beta hydrolase [Flexilinea flocculi]GAP41510.1 pimeloyl-ACP methyl ester carboxylesterase [Flexilinea flocculi]